MKARGAVAFDYGNNLRGQALKSGLANAFDYPGFVPAYIRPLFCEGEGPFRWAALSGDPKDIEATDEALLAAFPRQDADGALAAHGGRAGEAHGAAGPHLLAGLRRAGQGGEDLQRPGAGGRRSKAPIVIGRDHLDAGSVASPNRETEAMRDGSDAVADWPLLNLMVNVASGASWTSFHHGGGVGIGYSLHAGQVTRGRRHRRGRAAGDHGAQKRPCHRASFGTRTRGTPRPSDGAAERGVRIPMDADPGGQRMSRELVECVPNYSEGRRQPGHRRHRGAVSRQGRECTSWTTAPTRTTTGWS